MDEFIETVEQLVTKEYRTAPSRQLLTPLDASELRSNTIAFPKGEHPMNEPDISDETETVRFEKFGNEVNLFKIGTDTLVDSFGARINDHYYDILDESLESAPIEERGFGTYHEAIETYKYITRLKPDTIVAPKWFVEQFEDASVALNSLYDITLHTDEALDDSMYMSTRHKLGYTMTRDGPATNTYFEYNNDMPRDDDAEKTGFIVQAYVRDAPYIANEESGLRFDFE
jgi:hypothetical protein